jgi:hypothetical protein
MSSAIAAFSPSSSEHELYSSTAVLLEPLLQFLTSECIASFPMSASGPGLVDFVLQLIAANKERLYHMCGSSGASDPASAALSRISPVSVAATASFDNSAAAASRILSLPTAAQHRQEMQAMDAKIDALNAQLLAEQTKLADASSSCVAPAPSQRASVVNSCACVEAGVRRRDHAFLRQVFKKFEDSSLEPPRISQSNLPAAAAELFARAAASGSNAPSAVPCAVLEACHLCGSRGADFAEFVVASQSASQFQQYVNKLPLACIIADALGAQVGFDDDALQRFSQLSKAGLESAMQAATSGLKAELAKAQTEVVKRLAVKQQSSDQLSSNKYQAPRKMACGGINDFHAGLSGRIGSPSLNFEAGMRAEHCLKGGHDFEFTTENYKIKTTPEREWLQIAGDENFVRAAVPADDMKHGRVITEIVDLLQRPLAVKAALIKCEVIALSLYSGPMFEIYNCMLRQFPVDRYKKFSSQGNSFSTTIFVLVSAIQKLSRHMFLPPSIRLYRGFSSMEMPESFSKVDEDTGCSGYAEWGFISTTANKSVAIQYSGVDEGKPRATVLCIRPSSVDRGASIAEFSQCARCLTARDCFTYVTCAADTLTKRSSCGRRARSCSRRTRGWRLRCSPEEASSACALLVFECVVCVTPAAACLSVSTRICGRKLWNSCWTKRRACTWRQRSCWPMR